MHYPIGGAVLVSFFLILSVQSEGQHSPVQSDFDCKQLQGWWFMKWAWLKIINAIDRYSWLIYHWKWWFLVPKMVPCWAFCQASCWSRGSSKNFSKAVATNLQDRWARDEIICQVVSEISKGDIKQHHTTSFFYPNIDIRSVNLYDNNLSWKFVVFALISTLTAHPWRFQGSNQSLTGWSLGHMGHCAETGCLSIGFGNQRQLEANPRNSSLVKKWNFNSPNP